MIPAICRGAAAAACWQAVAVIGMRIAAPARRGRFEADAKPWLRSVVACLLSYAMLAAGAFIALDQLGYMTGNVMLALVFTGILAVVGAASASIYLVTRPFSWHAGRA